MRDRGVVRRSAGGRVALVVIAAGVLVAVAVPVSGAQSQLPPLLDGSPTPRQTGTGTPRSTPDPTPTRSPSPTSSPTISCPEGSAGGAQASCLPPVFSRISLVYDAEDEVFRGRVTSKEDVCERGRLVKLKKKRGTGSVKIGSDRSNRAGRWSVAQKATPGTYFARAGFKTAESNGRPISCYYARSAKLELR